MSFQLHKLQSCSTQPTPSVLQCQTTHWRYFIIIWSMIYQPCSYSNYQGSARDAMQTKYIYFNTMIIACCYFYCIAITTLLIVLHCHYPIAIEHHIFDHHHVRAYLLMILVFLSDLLLHEHSKYAPWSWPTDTRERESESAFETGSDSLMKIYCGSALGCDSVQTIRLEWFI